MPSVPRAWFDDTSSARCRYRERRHDKRECHIIGLMPPRQGAAMMPPEAAFRDARHARAESAIFTFTGVLGHAHFGRHRFTAGYRPMAQR